MGYEEDNSWMLLLMTQLNAFLSVLPKLKKLATHNKIKQRLLLNSNHRLAKLNQCRLEHSQTISKDTLSIFLKCQEVVLTIL
jgi:hypothetical protein